MSSPLSKTSSRCSSHVPRKSYGRFDFLVCDWSLQKKSYGAGEKIESDEFIMSDSSKWVIRIFPGSKCVLVYASNQFHFYCNTFSFNRTNHQKVVGTLVKVDMLVRRLCFLISAITKTLRLQHLTFLSFTQTVKPSQ